MFIQFDQYFSNGLKPPPSQKKTLLERLEFKDHPGKSVILIQLAFREFQGAFKPFKGCFLRIRGAVSQTYAIHITVGFHRGPYQL